MGPLRQLVSAEQPHRRYIAPCLDSQFTSAVECPTLQHPPAQVMQHNPAKPHKCSLNNFRKLRGSKGTHDCNSHNQFSSALNSNVHSIASQASGTRVQKSEEIQMDTAENVVCICVFRGCCMAGEGQRSTAWQPAKEWVLRCHSMQAVRGSTLTSRREKGCSTNTSMG